jgi:hypothetical protein
LGIPHLSKSTSQQREKECEREAILNYETKEKFPRDMNFQEKRSLIVQEL